MAEPTDSPATKKHADRSTAEAFAFSFFCDICGREWQSARYEVSAGRLAAPVAPALYRALWRNQHEAAYARANRDALFEFNRCPSCGRRVCNACFHLSETGLTDICIECLQKTIREK